MGLLDRFFKKKNKTKVNEEKINNVPEKKVTSHISTDFLTVQEKIDTSNSLYAKLEAIEDEIAELRDVLGAEEVNQLKEQYDKIMQLLRLSNGDLDAETTEVINKFRGSFEATRKKAQGISVLNGLKKINQRMDRDFNSDVFTDEEEGLEYLKLLSDSIMKLQETVAKSERIYQPIQKGIIKDMFNSESIKAKYRLLTLKMMYEYEFGGIVETRLLDRLHPIEKEMFAKYFKRDLEELSSQYNRFLLSKDTDGRKLGFSEQSQIELIQEVVDKINEPLGREKVSNGSFKEMFLNPESLTKFNSLFDSFIILKFLLNRYEECMAQKAKKQMEAKKQEEEKAQKELEERQNKEKRIEELRNLSNSEISQRIHEMDRDLSSTDNAYIRILDFQREIAVAKGLLTDTDDDLKLVAIPYEGAAKLIKMVNDNGFNFLAFPDSKEKGAGISLMAKNEVAKKILNKIIIKAICVQIIQDDVSSMYRKVGTFDTESVLKDYLDTLYRDGILKNIMVRPNKGKYEVFSYPVAEKDAQDRIDEFVEKMRSECSSEGFYKDVLCYISIPTTRNMIPILERFKQADIIPYLEPIPEKERNEIGRQDTHIYFRRDDLEKYKAIESEVSNGNVGIARLMWAESNPLGDRIANGIQGIETDQLDR